MKRTTRGQLSTRAQAFLHARATKVANSKDKVGEVDRLWQLQSNSAFKEVREMLRQMASGIQRCMYCEDSLGTDIEHFWPKSQHPERAFDWLNFLLACSYCNSNAKRSQFPLDANGAPLLIDPTAEDPAAYLQFVPETGSFVSSTPKGEKSIEVFGLDRQTLEQGRRNAWVTILALLEMYAQLKAAGDLVRTKILATVLRQHSFSAVLQYAIRIAQQPMAHTAIPASVLELVRNNKEIQEWAT
ncbi:hypothetical protein VZQ01_27130 [Myxococcus faecalis]|uniref:hypothetical protein n=1 Tax=Myxococcus TaxID=32 RepID=UPI001CBE39DC|nr:hypothetical protein [Myxococcus sp. XM-1-1-1]MBZ4413732.1 hypothetical protein [Myxococcus sp. XM-1-1-1]